MNERIASNEFARENKGLSFREKRESDRVYVVVCLFGIKRVVVVVVVSLFY